MTLIIGPKEVMPTFTIREPEKSAPVFVNDVFDHPSYTAVIVTDVTVDERSMPRERVVTYRACTRQELEENGYI
jgi:hypothetical protein